MIHIYTGDGKGKTTAAMGLVLRAIHAGQKVGILQFLKSRQSGEITLLSEYEQVSILRSQKGTKFSFQMNEEEKAAAFAEHNDQLAQIKARVEAGEFQTVVLDEVFGALSTALLDEALLEDFLASLPQNVELLMTGRGAAQKYIDMADYVTEMKAIKHPFDRGVKMRKGVEY